MQKNEEILPTILTSKEVCEILRISQRTLQTYRDKRIISFKQVGRKVSYTPSDIEEFMSSHHIQTNLISNE